MAEVITSFEQNLIKAEIPAGKKKVMLAAIHLFSKQGFSATTTAQIAKEAGVSEGTIYKYFSSKRELLNQLIAPMFEKIRDSFFTEISANQSLDDLITFVIKNRIDFASKNFELFKIVLQEFLTSSDKNIVPILKQLITGKDGLYSRLDKIKKAYPEINQNLTPQQMVQIFLGPLFGYLMQTNLMAIQADDKDASYRIMHNEMYAGLTQR